jgi:hypothetical protein
MAAKNYLFQSAEALNDKVADLYEKYWKPFDDGSKFWRAVVGQGRFKRPRIDQFLQHYLTLVKGDEVAATHLFAEFRDFARTNPQITPANHLLMLHGFGSIFLRCHIGYDMMSREGQFFHRLEELETTTFFPLLLQVFMAADIEHPQEVQVVLEDLESFLVRRMVCGLTTKAYNTLVRSLIQNMRGSQQSLANAIREFLLSQEAESTRWPTDDEFRTAWLNRPVYDLLSQGRVRVVLEALELASYTGKSEKVRIETKLTIEHIMPRQWHEYWPLPNDIPAEEAKLRRNQLIHTFGNLTLVTGKLNPSMSNSAWDTKKKALSEHGALSLNRKLCILDSWDEKAIEHRAAGLFDLAKAIWPRPVTQTGTAVPAMLSTSSSAEPTANSTSLITSTPSSIPDNVQAAVPSSPGVKRQKWSDWNSALAAVGNPAIVAYFRQEIEANRENYLPRRSIRYRIDHKKRWTVRARTGYAHVSQKGRFDGDIDFWRTNLSQPDEVEPIADGKVLRFHLFTERDCQFFHQAATKQLGDKHWTKTPDVEEPDKE